MIEIELYELEIILKPWFLIWNCFEDQDQVYDLAWLLKHGFLR